MRILLLLFCAALSFLPAAARAQSPEYNPQYSRLYDQAELDGLVAPVAVYADRGRSAVLSVRAVQSGAWQPAVKSLVAYPELLESMAESPQWTLDLGNAYVSQPAQVMATVQALRQRAYASGSLRRDAEQ